MPKICDLLPSTSQCQPTAVDWTAEFSWGASQTIFLSKALITDLHHASQLPIQDFTNRCRLLRDDISTLLASSSDESTRVLIDILKFTVGQVPISCFTATGHLPEAYDWTLWSISRNHDPNKIVNRADYRLPPFDGAHRSVNEFSGPFLVNWILHAYYLAVRFGGLDELALTRFHYCYAKAVEAIDKGDRDVGIKALANLTNWAAHTKHESLSTMVKVIESCLRHPDLSPKHKIQLGTILLGEASHLTNHNPATFARKMLEDHSTHFHTQEHLQYLVAATDTHGEWLTRKDEIISKIRTLRFEVGSASHSPMDINVAMEGRIRIIYGLVHLLSRVPDLTSLLSVVALWYGKDIDHEVNFKTLLVLSNDSQGTRWIWPNGDWSPANQDVEKSLEQLTVAISNAFTDYYRGPEGDRVPRVDERLRGTPQIQYALELERHTLSHYAIGKARENVLADQSMETIIFFPNYNAPAYAMINEFTQEGLLQNLSLERPANEPTISDVLIWPGESLFTDAEVEFLLTAGARFDLTVRVYEAGQSKQDFVRFFADSQADLLWIIGHGNHEPHHLERCGLNLTDDSIFSLRDFSSLPKVNRNRAVVANICSGGAARVIGGLGITGIAGILANARQRVITHGWPIDMYAALAFGGVYFSSLSKSGLRRGLRRAQQILKEQQSILTEVAETDPDMQIVERLKEENLKIRLENVFSWGSAAIYC